MSKGNGVATASQQFEQMRQVVVEQELSARSWRAMLQKMQDTLEIDRIQADYDAVVKKNEERLKQQQEAYRLQAQAAQLPQQPISD
jgi:hypothetical protein